MSRAVRALAARVVADVMGGSAMDGSLERARDKLDQPADRALLSALCFGTIRHFPSNRAIVRALLTRPSQKLKPLVEALLAVGIEQLEHMRVAPHAAVSETVAAARALRQDRATGLINALLRRFLRERDQVLAGLADRDDLRHDHPGWLLDALRRDWPDDWPAIVAANNTPAPLWLRVNSLRLSAVDYARQLESLDDCDVAHGTLSNVALSLTPPVPVSLLPGFDAGDVTVQDQSAQLAVALMRSPARGADILDACAAPGGKTGHLMERFAAARVLAVDHSEARLARLRETLQRLGHSVEARCMDLTDASSVTQLPSFDRILMDAPCTGSGVIRRHPDIKLLRRADDSAKLGMTQRAILDNLFARLKPGGELLYVTCSVFRAENDDSVGAFLARTPQAISAPVASDATWGRATQFGRQILPGELASDGFYYARIVRQR